MADGCPGRKWDVPGRAKIEMPQDPWNEDRPASIRARITAKATELGADITDPRNILSEPALCKLLWPCVDRFMLSDLDLKKDIQEFIAMLVAKGSQWRFPDALAYVKKHAVADTIETDLVESVRFVAKCVCMDPVNVDQALNVVYAFLTGNDHRVKAGSLAFKDDFPTVFIAGSGGGKSPLIMKLVLEQILSKVQAIVDRIPGVVLWHQ